MLHFVAKWLISRSIDENRRTADWLRRWIDRDDELKRFEILSRQLGDRLSDDAHRWTCRQEIPTGARSADRIHSSSFAPRKGVPSRSESRQCAAQHWARRKSRVAWSAGGLTLATAAVMVCAWFVIGRLHSREDRAKQPDAAENRRIAATAKLTAADRAWVVAAWKTGHKNLVRLRARGLPRANSEIPKLPDLAPIAEPAEAAGSTVGHVLATLDRGMEAEQQKLAFEAKAAFSFFAHRLPVGIARLVGWRGTVD